MKDRVSVQDISKRDGEVLSPISLEELVPLPPPYDKLDEQPAWKELAPAAKERMVCNLDGVVALSLPQPENEAEEKKYVENPFAIYLSGMIYEALGEINDAYIDYKKVYSLRPDVPYLEGNLLRLSKA